MKSKLNLTTDQNKQLVGLSLEEKLQRLCQWQKEGQISLLQFSYFKNRWINKEAKAKQENLSKSRTVIEGRLNKVIDDLRCRLNYVTCEDREFFLLSRDELDAIKYLVHSCPLSKIDDILVLGLRYPDKKLNSFCVSYIKQFKTRNEIFWVKAWNDVFIPSDTIRLMYEGDKISSSFNLSMLEKLLPIMKKQCEKEVLRRWASSCYEDLKKSHERLNKFNKLVKDVGKKINSLRNE